MLSLPRFTVAFAAELSKHFEALGMTLAFDADRADFGGIVPLAKQRDRLHISQIANRTVIEVNEQGTEAAGATAVEFAQRSMQLESETFIVDRPFLFLVADQASGLILFMGRLVDPRSKGP